MGAFHALRARPPVTAVRWKPALALVVLLARSALAPPHPAYLVSPVPLARTARPQARLTHPHAHSASLGHGAASWAQTAAKTAKRAQLGRTPLLPGLRRWQSASTVQLARGATCRVPAGFHSAGIALQVRGATRLGHRIARLAFHALLAPGVGQLAQPRRQCASTALRAPLARKQARAVARHAKTALLVHGAAKQVSVPLLPASNAHEALGAPLLVPPPAQLACCARLARLARYPAAPATTLASPAQLARSARNSAVCLLLLPAGRVMQARSAP